MGSDFSLSLLQCRSDSSFVRVYVCERERVWESEGNIFLINVSSLSFSLRHYGTWPNRSVSSLMHTHTQFLIKLCRYGIPPRQDITLMDGVSRTLITLYSTIYRRN